MNIRIAFSISLLLLILCILILQFQEDHEEEGETKKVNWTGASSCTEKSFSTTGATGGGIVPPPSAQKKSNRSAYNVVVHVGPHKMSSTTLQTFLQTQAIEGDTAMKPDQIISRVVISTIMERKTRQV